VGDLIDSADKGGTFFNPIITGDEAWCFLYDSQLKRQSAAWKLLSSSRKKEPRQDWSKGKVVLELLIDLSGTGRTKCISEGATVNKHRYKQMLRLVRKSIRC
jgi:hypothetical protein